ncbi:MAG: hypothetical protein DRI69_02620 [Bacteroidetes bacterium]|nr:MAG: hypothetical protein DRI69_02620 [Bacteroidota bacterium]
MTIAPFVALYPRTELIGRPDAFFSASKHEFPDFRNRGFLQEDSEEGIFIYDIITPKRTYSGVLACLDILDYIDGKVMPHENTIAAKEQYMTTLVLERKALIKPVLLSYKRNQSIEQVVSDAHDQKPFFEIEIGEERHVLYKLTDKKTVEKLQETFRYDVSKAYIADGHHRCATSAKLYRESYMEGQANAYQKFLCVLFPFEQLVIHDYNRIIDILNIISPTMFMARMSKLCDIKPLSVAAKPKRKFEMTMYILGEWYLLTWKNSVIKKYAVQSVILDGAILNKEVLNKILDIKDVREDPRLRYVEGIAGVEGVMAKADKSLFRIAFCVYPVQMSEIVQIAEVHKTLPPKSTWFEPRIKNGLISKPL